MSCSSGSPKIDPWSRKSTWRYNRYARFEPDRIPRSSRAHETDDVQYRPGRTVPPHRPAKQSRRVATPGEHISSRRGIVITALPRRSHQTDDVQGRREARFTTLTGFQTKPWSRMSLAGDDVRPAKITPETMGLSPTSSEVRERSFRPGPSRRVSQRPRLLRCNPVDKIAPNSETGLVEQRPAGGGSPSHTWRQGEPSRKEASENGSGRRGGDTAAALGPENAERAVGVHGVSRRNTRPACLGCPGGKDRVAIPPPLPHRPARDAQGPRRLDAPGKRGRAEACRGGDR